MWPLVCMQNGSIFKYETHRNLFRTRAILQLFINAFHQGHRHMYMSVFIAHSTRKLQELQRWNFLTVKITMEWLSFHSCTEVHFSELLLHNAVVKVSKSILLNISFEFGGNQIFFFVHHLYHPHIPQKSMTRFCRCLKYLSEHLINFIRWIEMQKCAHRINLSGAFWSICFPHYEIKHFYA